MLLTFEQLRPVMELYDQCQLLRVHELAQSYGPLKDWRGPGARIAAGRIAMNLGAPQLGHVLHGLAFREDPKDPEACYYHARNVFERRGPLFAWEFLRSRGELDGAPPEIQSDWFSTHAMVLGWLRDFEYAEAWLERAEVLAPDKPWLWIERCALMEREDRYEEALAAARESLELRPWYRPGVQAVAHLLELLDRDTEALELLKEATTKIQSGPVMAQLAVLQTELGQYEDARESWEKVAGLSPLMEKEFAQYLAAKRSDAAYYCGDYDRAIELAKESKNPFHEKAAAKMAEAKAQGTGKRVLLPVGFVRQHHVTCAPATLSALSRFWRMPAEHLEVAEKICYDGTPAHGERQWAGTGGWVAREFRVTWDAACALIDRKVPFTLTTIEAQSGHLQSVTGYDSLRGTLLIRDPYQRTSGEFIAEPLFERYKSSGPRGMALVPKDKANLLEGVDLPEAELYDDFHDVQRALVEHRRQEAQEAYESLAAKGPAGRLTLHAQRSLAAYDGDHVEGLAATEKLLELFPDDPNLILSKLSMLRALARRDERLALLRQAADKKTGSEPVFWYHLAQELKDDAREHPEAVRLLRRALRYTRFDAGCYFILASLLWDQRRFEEALQLYRFAMTLDDKNEMLAQSYFVAARHFKQERPAIRLMRDRFMRFGKRSSRPAITLFWAYEEIGQLTEAFRALEEALALRPDDGDLLLAAANAQARHGAFDKADALLAKAKDRSRETAWLRGSAEIASFRGDFSRARDLWRQVLDAEPLALDAHRHLSLLLAQTEGPAAALKHLESACNRFRYNYPLHQLWIEYLRDEGPEAAEPVIRRLMEIHPADPWARRELIWAQTVANHVNEAAAQVEELLRLDPTSPSSHYVRGKVLARQEKFAEAREAYRHAVTLSVDADYAINELIAACDTVALRKEALEFVRRELTKQTIFGDGLLAYRQVARETLDGKELLSSLKEAVAARPDLWHAWSALVRQYTDMNLQDEAEQTGREAVERFPLLPRLWQDLAMLYRVRGDAEGEIAALEQALATSPGWSVAVRQLAEVYDRSGQFAKAKQLLEGAVARSPLDALNHGGLADVLWKLGDKEAAVARIGQAVKLEPGYHWAWDTLRRWCADLDRPEQAVSMARELTTTKAGEARSWMVLARVLDGPEALDERVAALDKAIALSPRAVDAYEQRSKILAEAGRYDEAEAGCRPAVFGENVPIELRARRAWVSAHKGDMPGAIAQMRQILAEDQNFYWGWGQLAEWCRITGAKDEFLKAATQMAALWPHDPQVLGTLGDARLLNGDRARAKFAFRRAMEIAPDYEYGAAQLFDVLLEDGEHADAAGVLDVLRAQTPGPRTQARGVELACKRDDRDAALQALAVLCVAPLEDDVLPLQMGASAVEQAGWHADLEQVMRAAAGKAECDPWVGEWLTGRLADTGRLHEGMRLVEHLEKSGASADVAAAALRGYLRRAADLAATDSGGEARAGRSAVYEVLRARTEQLRGDVSLWGTAGYALHTMRDYPRVVAWMADWRDRADAEGWMLVNVAEAHRALGNDAVAHEINTRGLAVSPYGNPRGIHTLWLAADAIFAGDPPSARQMLSGEDFSRLGPPYQFLREMLEATLAVLLAGNRRSAFPAARSRVAAAVAAHPAFERDGELRALYRKCVRLISRSGVGLRGRIWSLTRALKAG
jgi:tetratricopeptide (TPR) repeat protein